MMVHPGHLSLSSYCLQFPTSSLHNSKQCMQRTSVVLWTKNNISLPSCSLNLDKGLLYYFINLWHGMLHKKSLNILTFISRALLYAISVYMYVRMFVTLQNTHFRVSWKPLVKKRNPNIGILWQNFQKKRGGLFFHQNCYKALFLTSLLWLVGELAGEGLWLWLLPVVCLHFNGTLMALPQHYHGTTTALPWHFHGISKTNTPFPPSNPASMIFFVVFFHLF